MSGKENPIILELAEGLRLTPDLAKALEHQAAKVQSVTGQVLLFVAHGTKRATQQVEHHVGPEMDEAVMALPRIATALENIAEHLRALSMRGLGTGPR
jgi:hypothetical protein